MTVAEVEGYHVGSPWVRWLVEAKDIDGGQVVLVAEDGHAEGARGNPGGGVCMGGAIWCARVPVIEG